jgi:large subunit ribosomal protein L13
VEKTYYPKGDVESSWILVDANEASLGRIATQITNYLLGKHKPIYTPGAEVGDFVVVVNASHMQFTGKRLVDKKYYHHSNYPGGLKTVTLKDQMQNHPDRVIRAAVWGMLPKNRLGHRLIKKLKIYAGNEHPHKAQNPQPVVKE